MDSEIVSFGIKLRDGTQFNWDLRMISVAEDQEYQQRFTQVAGKKGAARAEGEYRIYSDALSTWAHSTPTRQNGKTDDEGNVVVEPIGEGPTAEAVKAFFADKSVSKEWHAVTAISTYRNQLFPSVVFPKASE